MCGQTRHTTMRTKNFLRPLLIHSFFVSFTLWLLCVLCLCESTSLWNFRCYNCSLLRSLSLSFHLINRRRECQTFPYGKLKIRNEGDQTPSVHTNWRIWMGRVCVPIRMPSRATPFGSILMHNIVHTVVKKCKKYLGWRKKATIFNAIFVFGITFTWLRRYELNGSQWIRIEQRHTRPIGREI